MLELNDWLNVEVKKRMLERAWQVEALLADAIALQDFGKLDRLHVVEQVDARGRLLGPGVASYVSDLPEVVNVTSS